MTYRVAMCFLEQSVQQLTFILIEPTSNDFSLVMPQAEGMISFLRHHEMQVSFEVVPQSTLRGTYDVILTTNENGLILPKSQVPSLLNVDGVGYSSNLQTFDLVIIPK